MGQDEVPELRVARRPQHVHEVRFGRHDGRRHAALLPTYTPAGVARGGARGGEAKAVEEEEEEAAEYTGGGWEARGSAAPARCHLLDA